MTMETNAFNSFTAIGNREDLEDVIYDISPTETPFMSNVARTRATATFHEWQTDALAAAAANRQLEGDAIAGQTQSPTTRVGNDCQISYKSITVSGTQDAVSKAGRARDTAYLTAKAGRELKRDIEFALTQNQAASVGGATTARSLAGVEGWLSTNYNDNGVGTTPGVASGRVGTAPTDGTTRALTETLLKAVIKTVWSAGGDPKVLMVGPFNKQTVSGFGGIATIYKNAPAGQATIVGAADLYVSDFGEHTVVPNRFSRDRTALVLDMDYWAVAYLRPIQSINLARTGDAEKRAILAEYTLVSRNEAASGKVADLTTA